MNPRSCPSAVLLLLLTSALVGVAQEPPTNSDKPVLNTSGDGTSRLIIESPNPPPEPDPLFLAQATSIVTLAKDAIAQRVDLQVTVIQGSPNTFSLGLQGKGDVTSVTGKTLQSWAIRQEKNERFLDLTIVAPPEDNDAEKSPVPTQHQFALALQESDLTLPLTHSLAHLQKGKAVSFRSTVEIPDVPGLTQALGKVTGFVPIETEKPGTFLQYTGGGSISLKLTPSGGLPSPIEFTGGS
ncbi:MAG: hypothetical protein AAGJ31_09915, partial [Verrucomicrobiota bacterium]